MRKAPTSCSSISITPSVRRATLRTARRPVVLVISIHALREEGDPWTARMTNMPNCYFLSTPSVRRATARQRAGGILLVISIHALREEGDVSHKVTFASTKCISIHALREEGDSPVQPRRMVGRIFLSTPPRGRATCYHCNKGGEQQIFLSTPSVREGRLAYKYRFATEVSISIHALRDGGRRAFELRSGCQ